MKVWGYEGSEQEKQLWVRDRLFIDLTGGDYIPCLWYNLGIIFWYLNISFTEWMAVCIHLSMYLSHFQSMLIGPDVSFPSCVFINPHIHQPWHALNTWSCLCLRHLYNWQKSLNSAPGHGWSLLMIITFV